MTLTGWILKHGHFLSALCLYYSLCLYWFCWQFQASRVASFPLKSPAHRKVSKSLCEGNWNMEIVVNLLLFIHFSLTKAYSAGWGSWKNGLNHMLTSSTEEKKDLTDSCDQLQESPDKTASRRTFAGADWWINSKKSCFTSLVCLSRASVDLKSNFHVRNKSYAAWKKCCNHAKEKIQSDAKTEKLQDV